MKVVLAGGTGQAGTLLARELATAGHAVVVLSRGRPDQDGSPRTVFWDARTLGDWAAEVDGAGAVINLAGRSINCRHTPANQRLMLQSRLDATRVIGRAISEAARPPKVWLNASAATLYSHLTDRPHDETTGVIGGSEPGLPPKWRFILGLVKEWEAAQREADTPKTRKVALRISLLLGVGKGGVFDTLYTLVRLGLGGKVGDGRQYVSWIHEQDFARAVSWLLEHDSLEGPVNLAAPDSLSNADFMAVLRTVQGMPLGLPTPAPLLELGAWLMRTESKLVLKSRRVRPGRLLDSGFEFRYPDWDSAARELVTRRSV